ncbi:MAG: hypothetical protein HW388_1313 [Dehalococcoidia bacterium]|nr:hypothetical protein [Dehalococcoidia bacterium]
MILLKACPRCRGDLKINRDLYGEYKECLQCGYMEDVDKEPQTSGSATARAGKQAAQQGV